MENEHSYEELGRIHQNRSHAYGHLKEYLTGEKIIMDFSKEKLIGPGELVDTRSIMELTAAAVEVKETKELLYSVVPRGYELAVHDIAERNESFDRRREENQLGRPLRHKGHMAVADVDSFITMVTREAIEKTTMVVADLDDLTFHAIINFAEDGKIAGYGDRVISLTMQRTPEFQRWSDKDRHRMSQKVLADFLEENMDSITAPDADEIIDMISNLKIKSKATYSSVVDVSTGQQSVSFSETLKGETQNGSMEFFSHFTIAVAPFRGAKRHEMKCRLRFGVENERMEVFFAIINKDQAMETAFETETELVRKAMTKLKLPMINQ